MDRNSLHLAHYECILEDSIEYALEHLAGQSIGTTPLWEVLHRVASDTFPACCHRSARLECSLLYEYLYRALERVLKVLEERNCCGNRIFECQKLLENLAHFTWPCAMCFPGETLLSKITTHLGSTRCLRMFLQCLEKTLDWESNLDSVQCLIPVVTSKNALTVATLCDLSAVLCKCIILFEKRDDNLRELVAIFRRLFEASQNNEMTIAMQVCLGLTTPRQYDNLRNGNHVKGMSQQDCDALISALRGDGLNATDADDTVAAAEAACIQTLKDSATHFQHYLPFDYHFDTLDELVSAVEKTSFFRDKYTRFLR